MQKKFHVYARLSMQKISQDNHKNTYKKDDKIACFKRRLP